MDLLACIDLIEKVEWSRVNGFIAALSKCNLIAKTQGIWNIQNAG
jgi:hypothetical protein